MTSTSHASLALGLLLSLALIQPSTFAQSTTSIVSCPLDCVCSDIEIHHQSYGHAKCSSLNGLREADKDGTIQSVDCSAIAISKITTQLDKLTNLTRLDLSSNHIVEVPKLNKRIRVLNLAHNSITSGKLTKIPQSVRHLNLSHNDITYLPIDFMQLSYLKSLELMGNPINCTCETLQVRNWLQENRVWTDNHVTCSSPLQFKGRPWLQVKQSDVCQPFAGKPTSLPFAWDDKENELMLGDQPVFGDDSGSGGVADEDELEKDYMPIEASIRAATSASIVDTEFDYVGSGDLDDDTKVSHLTRYEGSGDVRLVTHTTEQIEEDGSGSGDGLGIISIGPQFDVINEDPTTEDDTEETTRAPYELNIFNNGVSIHKVDDVPSTEAPSTASPVAEEIIVPARMAPTTQEKNEPTSRDELNKPHSLSEAESNQIKETQSTYILLGLLGFLLLGLIAFVIFRKKSSSRSNRRDKSDVENPTGTELLDMNKQLLGKPINRNGNVEIIPLMPKNKDQWDDEKKPTNGNGNHISDKTELQQAAEPLLNRLNAPSATEHEKPQKTVPSAVDGAATQPFSEKNEDNNNLRPEPTAPVAHLTPPPVQVQPQPVQHDTLPTDNDEVFLPHSPKPLRYSPVYSPVTGRVKIKLTETPKPRTPMLITRSRSNAGEIITTPVHPPKNQ